MEIIQASVPLFFLLIAVELLFTRLGRRPFYRLNDSISDLSAGTLSQIAGIFTKLILVAAFNWTSTHLSVRLLSPQLAWPHGVMIGHSATGWTFHPMAMVGWSAAFLAVDFAYYWFHRMSHEVNLFWAGHIVHHSSEEYNLSVALRQSALGGVLSWIFYMPLAALGMSVQQFAVCYALNLIYQFWIHTRAVERLPAWAEAVLNTPSHHRVHHGVNPEYQDRNYAGVLIVWDRWFGTFTPEVREPVYGLTSPLRSWNPIWSQLHHYVAIVRSVVRADNWSDRRHVVFGAPAWRPLSWGGPVALPTVDAKSFRKFDPPVAPLLARYAVVHFALTIPAALWVLSTASTLAVWPLTAASFYVALSLTNVGGILEGRRWAFASEQARLGALGAAAAVMLTQRVIPLWSATSALVICVASALTLWSHRHAFIEPSDERMDVEQRATLDFDAQ